MARPHSLLNLLLSFAIVMSTVVAQGPLPEKRVSGIYKTNAERFAHGLTPLKPSWIHVSKPLSPRTSQAASVTVTSQLGVYKGGVLQCYIGGSGGTCVPAASALTFTVTYTPGATGSVPIAAASGGYFALVGLSSNEVMCLDTPGDLSFGTSSALYPANSPPSGPNSEYETTVWNIDSTSLQITTATWTNASPPTDCASSDVSFYLNPAPRTVPGRPTPPQTMIATADPTSSSIGSASLVTFAFVQS